MASFPRRNKVNTTFGTVEVHPYVQGRLRALPRQDETTGILLGTAANGVTHVTGFKRATPRGLSQAASDAGRDFVGFYRLQVSTESTLTPEDEELLRDAQPDGRSLFLLVKETIGGVEATGWISEYGGAPVAESVPLEAHRPPDATPTTRETALFPASGESVVRGSSKAHRPPDATPTTRETALFPASGESVVRGSLEGTFVERRKEIIEERQNEGFTSGLFERRRPESDVDVPRMRVAEPTMPRNLILLITIAFVAVAGVIYLRMERPVPSLFLDLQSGGTDELSAVWEQEGVSAEKLQSAKMSILDGTKERTLDLTRNFTPRGRIKVRPTSPDVIITLRVKYANTPLVSRSATYVGFAPPVREVAAAPPPAAVPVAAPAPASVATDDGEVAALRKRNKELEEAVTALRKHFLQ